MNIIQYHYIKYILVAAALFSFALIIFEIGYYRWIKKYWFFKRSLTSYLSTLFLWLGFMLLLFSILDLRGPSEEAKVSIQDQYTIILVDTSLSMLAEDVRPNRMEKALMVARHFIKKAYGHQISLVIFSDIQKQIVPFSDDIELLDSRLAALSRPGFDRGGSNIKQAIIESINYFQAGKKVSHGNILVFSDFENQDSFDQKIPSDIVLGLVGVGTSEGSGIPMRGADGRFYRYKTHNNQQVRSHLDKTYMKKLAGEVENSQVWYVGTSDMPTEEMTSFFSKNYEKKLSNRNIQIRPVVGHYFIILGGALISLAAIFSLFKTFRTSLSIIITVMLLCSNRLDANESALKDRYLNEMKEGQISTVNKLKLAELFLREKDYEKAEKLFQETNPKYYLDNPEIHFNFVTTAMLRKRPEDVAGVMLDLSRKLKKGSNDPKFQDLLNKLRQNTLLLVTIDKKSGEKSENKKQDSDNKQEESKNKPGENQKEEKKEDKGGNANNDKKQNEELKEKKADKKNDKNEQDKKEEKKEENQEKKNQTLKQKENEIRQKRNMVSMPTILRQIMDRDKNFQENYLSTKLKDVKTGKTRKDW